MLLVRHTCAYGLAIGFNELGHLSGTDFCGSSDWPRNYNLNFPGEENWGEYNLAID